tara:strand:- start:1251 stop:1436 length:186 start_codon:yes stop_codon:yes gene_type:complete
MRVPRFLHRFLLRHGFQDAWRVGEPSRYSGLSLSRRGTGECLLRVRSWRTLAQFLLHRRFR